MLCSFGFVDDITSLHNEINGYKSETTRIFRGVRQVAAPGAKYVVSDYILLFNCIEVL